MARPTPLIEKALISRLISGDYSAFSSIFNAYYKDLVLFAARFTNDVSNAEEIVQDTFVWLWEKHEYIKVNTSLKSYLLKSVQNKCIDWYRHRKIMQAHNDFVTMSSSLAECNTDKYILHSELQEQIEIMLEKLPEEIAGTFRMNRLKGLKYKEIAEKLNVSERTVEVRIGKALQFLRDNLKDYF